MQNQFNLNDSALGKNSPYVNTYTPALLFAIPRHIKRAELGDVHFYGVDIWNAYEVSWLNQNGKPEVRIAEIIYDANSPCMVESKSLKLYLNSFNNSRFADATMIQQNISNDLQDIVQSEVTCNLFSVESQRYGCNQLQGICLDGLDVDCDAVAGREISIGTNVQHVTETLCTHLLKSNCLVTGQPDFGSLQILYTGQSIDRISLLQYIVSLRDKMEFHEQCIERIFCKIMTDCAPSQLQVVGRYTRRGGIDINPMRASYNVDNFNNMRAFRQ